MLRKPRTLLCEAVVFEQADEVEEYHATLSSVWLRILWQLNLANILLSFDDMNQKNINKQRFRLHNLLKQSFISASKLIGNNSNWNRYSTTKFSQS
jgi:hypothetical protein